MTNEDGTDRRLIGATAIPNIVLWPASAIFITLLATLASFMHQDRNRLATLEVSDSRQNVALDTNRKDIDNLLSMWNSVNKTMQEMDRKMDRLMP